jgi:hypothetical protein
MSGKEGEKSEGGGGTKVEPRLKYLETRTQTAFKHVKGDKFSKSFSAEANRETIENFLNDDRIRCLLFLGDAIVASTEMPEKLPGGKVVYFLKRTPVALTEKNIAEGKSSLPPPEFHQPHNAGDGAPDVPNLPLATASFVIPMIPPQPRSFPLKL